MTQIPKNAENLGYFAIEKYKISRYKFFDATLSMHFIDKVSQEEVFCVKLENVVAFNYKNNIENLSFLRVDSDGSTYGFDIATRLGNPKLEKYMVLYIFEDEEHSSFIFRGIAEHILILPPDSAII